MITLRTALNKLCLTGDRGAVTETVCSLLAQRPVTVAELLLEPDFATGLRWIGYRDAGDVLHQIRFEPERYKDGQIVVRSERPTPAPKYVFGPWFDWTPQLSTLTAPGVLVDPAANPVRP